MFIGREKELAGLEKAYSDEGFRLVVVNGLKNYGKTTLIEEFCRNKSAVYFTASQASSRSNLNAFSRSIFKYFGVDGHEPFQFWDSALSYIARTYKGSRIIVVIEGFDILANNDAAFLDVFTRIIDTELRYSAVMAVVSCENVGFLKNSPVRGKINGLINLGKFLTDENIAKLKERESKRSGAMQRANFVKVPADRVILREGIRNNDMYKIVSGRAICTINNGTDNEYLLGSLNEGKTFGEYSLLTGKPGIYTVTSFTDMLLLRISRGDFMSFIGMNAENSVNIMRNMAAMMNVMKVNIDMLNGELNPPD